MGLTSEASQEHESWDDRLPEMLSEDNLEELYAIEQAAEENVEGGFHNPYLDAFEAVYGSRLGFAPLFGDRGGYVSRDPGDAIRPGDSAPLKQEATTWYMAIRGRWVDRYAWAIPNEDTISTVAQFSPIVEVGAGNGYWAYLLEQKDADVECYDKEPPECVWHPVQEGTEDVLENDAYDDRALFLCWPDYSTPMAVDCLENYEGDTLIYVGEGPGGCNASDAFFDQLDDGEWQRAHQLAIPQWEGLHDDLSIYHR